MWIFNSVFGKIFEYFFYPFSNLSPWIGMISISFLTGLFMLFIFRFTSNQKGIRKVKNKIKAHLLELRLFQDSLVLSFKAQGNILRYNLKYISYSAKPMLIMIIPLILILIQLNLWFGYKALSPGEKAILKVKLKENFSLLDLDISIESSPGYEIETPPLRIEEERELDWRLRAGKKGVHDLVLILNGQKFKKKMAVAQAQLNKLSPTKVQRNFIAEIMNPGEAPLPSDSTLEAIEIVYPSKNMNFFGWQIHWLIVYFALSIIFGFAFKSLFGVEI